MQLHFHLVLADCIVIQIVCQIIRLQTCIESNVNTLNSQRLYVFELEVKTGLYYRYH